MDRREFLRRAALTGSGLALGSAFTGPLLERAAAAPTTAPAQGRSPQPTTLNDIEHIVILMQENRSYDHYFGSYRNGLGFNDRSDTAMKAYANLDRTRTKAKPKGVLLPWHLDTRHDNAACSTDVNHEWNAMHLAWNDGANDKFVFVNGPRPGNYNAMGYYTRADLPLYYELADAFTLCDHYFCSVLGPTGPNRHYATAATIDPMGVAGGPVPSGSVEPDVVAPLGEDVVTTAGKYTWTTMPERLQSAGISWKVYQAPGASRSTLASNSVLLRYVRFVSDPKSDLFRNAFLPLFPKDLFADIEADTLPQVSWVQPKSPGFDEHPPFAPNAGERLVGSVVRTLLENPRVFAKTALIVTYDENGGFFDHLAPPVAPPGTPGEFIPEEVLPDAATGITGPIGFGFRVPTLVISPFSRGGNVSSDVFDHTSLLRFIEARFGVEVPNLSEWRRTTAGDLTSTLDFANTRTDVPKLSLPLLDAREVKKQCKDPARYAAPPLKQKLPRQEH